MIVDIPNKGKFDLRDGGPWADAFGNAGSVFYLESEQKFYTIETKGISMGIKLGAPILSSCSCNRGVPKELIKYVLNLSAMGRKAIKPGRAKDNVTRI